LLSAAPLLPPVVRMIQRAMRHSVRSTQWAELLLSGLVHRSDGGAVVTGPEGRGYDFVPGVRELLLTAVSRRERPGRLRTVPGFVNRHLGGTLDFPALLSPESAAGLADGRRLQGADRPLAEVAIAVLRGLGGVYRDKAEQLVNMLNEDLPKNGQTRAIQGS